MCLGQNSGGAPGGGLGLRNGLVDEPGRMRQAAQELALVGQIHRAKLGVGLQEEAIGR